MTKKRDGNLVSMNALFKSVYGPAIKRMFGASYIVINILESDSLFKKNNPLGNLVLLDGTDKICLPSQTEDDLDEFKSYRVESGPNLVLFEDQAEFILEVLGWKDVVKNSKVIPRNANTETLFG